MKSSSPSRLTRALSFLQASLLIISIMATSFPVQALAQATTDIPVEVVSESPDNSEQTDLNDQAGTGSSNDGNVTDQEGDLDDTTNPGIPGSDTEDENLDEVPQEVNSPTPQVLPFIPPFNVCDIFPIPGLCPINVPPPQQQETVQVHIYKYLDNGETEEQVPDNYSGAPGFPMKAFFPGGPAEGANYDLGGATPNLGGAPHKYSAQTSEMTAPANYITYERTTDIDESSNVLPRGAACEADMYRLVGYRSGTSLEGAEDGELLDEAPEYTGLVNDRHLIVVNEDCDDVLEQEPQMCSLVSDGRDTYVGTIPASETYEHEAWLDEDGAQWIWDAPKVTNPSEEQTVAFTRTFDVTGTPGTAELQIAADNRYEVSVNDVPVAECNANGATEPNYAALETCTVPVVSGENTLTFTVTNYAGPNDSEQNPAGLYYKLTVEDASCSEVPPTQTSDVTVCKVSDAGGNPGLSDWQLYLKGNNVQNDLSVPSTNPSGVDSNTLMAGVSYLVTAMGTWNNQGGANPVDAEYSTTDGWATQMDGYTGYGEGILELEIEETDTEWGPYNPAHTYRQIFTPTSAGPVNFRIFDGDTATHQQNEGWFGDNSGSLTVHIDEAYAGTTEENGCVTLEDVPYGTYTVGEVAQENWSLTEVTGAEGSAVDGTTVVIDSPTESFTLMNHYDDGTQEPGQCVIESDITTLEGGSPSKVATFIHESWTAIIAGASWIWGDEAVEDPESAETQVFTKTFWLDNVSTGGTLEIAADNSYTVTLNGAPIGADTGEVNYTAEGQDSITILPTMLQQGSNTLVITVTNFAMEGGTTETNPAGLLYKLTVNGSDCEEQPPAQETLKVHIFKYLDDGEGNEAQVADGSGETPFPMTATWNATNIGAGTAPYVLGDNHGGATRQYAADTSPMSTGADYTTSEVTDGSVVVPADSTTCPAGKYRLLGYREGNTLTEAENDDLSSTAPVYTGLTNDKYIIVVNEDCDDVNGEDPGGEDPTPRDERVVVSPADMNGWDILNYDVTDNSDDSSTTELGTKGTFVTGPGTPPEGTGSFEQDMGPNGDEADRIRTSEFNGVRLADIDTLGYSTYVQQNNSGQATYLQLRLDRDADGAWDDTMFFEPVYQNGDYGMVPGAGPIPDQGDVTAGQWQTWDARNGGWWIEAGGPPLETIDHYLSQWPDAVLATDTASIRLQVGFGAGAWDNYLGNMDAFVIGVNDGVEDVTTTFDFEPTAVVGNPDDGGDDDNDSNGGRSGSRRSNNDNNNDDDNDGEVLGASTSEGEVLGAACPLLTQYMREGHVNDANEVTKLQTFLNGEMGSGLTVSGLFDALTTSAVNAFQLKYASEVLAPWVPFGLQANVPTGYVYKTTLWKINDIACPDMEVAAPQLP